MQEGFHARLLDELLGRAFGDLAPAALLRLREQLRWVVLPGGQTLVAQGEPGDALYLCVSGRLRAYVDRDEGPPRLLREMGRGDIIGELSLYTDAPRSATVVAVRDSVLVRLDKQDFMAFLEREPRAGVQLTRQIVRRLHSEHEQVRYAAPVVQALLPVSDGVDAADLAAQLSQALAGFGRVRLVDHAAALAAVGPPGADAAGWHQRASLWLDEAEAAQDFLLLLADDTPSAWSQLCCRAADEVLLLAAADAAPRVHENERVCLLERPPRPRASEAAEILLLLHPPASVAPRGTAAWLARRPVADHFHVRPALPRDLQRLARLQARRGVGLVLAGGGARGLSHLGLLQALQAQGVEVDCLGGTSIGAMMAALAGCDRPPAEWLPVARAAFGSKPTSDYSWLPLVSLIKGRRLRQCLRQVMGSLLGLPEHELESADLADLWKNTFVVATNYSQARQELLERGPLSHLLRASAAIPGALPPVVLGGDLLCDGGSFNNFPVDLMRARRGIGIVLGADLSVHKPRKLDFEELPSTWQLLRERWLPRARRRFRLPSLPVFLTNVTILYSVSRRKQAQAACDVYFNPPLYRVGFLDWRHFDRIVEAGRAHAAEVLAQPAVQQCLRAAAPGLAPAARATETNPPTGAGLPAAPARGHNEDALS